MARREEPSNHGWFVDPEKPEQLRFWSGTAWTSLTKFPTAHEAEAARGAGDPSSGAPVPRPRPAAEGLERRPSPRPSPSPRPVSARVVSEGFDADRPGVGGPVGGILRTREVEADDDDLAARLLAENSYTAATLAITALYLVVAITTGFVLAGILPVVLAITAVRRREKAAFIAALAAVVAVMVWVAVRA